MKYGIVTYHKRPMRKGSNNTLNLGDPIQTYAMEYIYKTMNVLADEVVNISRYHAAEYNGEYVVLPFNCFNMISNQADHKYKTLPLSPKIIPVFISFHLHSRHIDKRILDNLRAYQPIGCRDEETMINLRRHGLVAYLSGCATALLPRRTNVPKVKKTFFVDIPDTLLKYIPKEIKENSEYISHQPSFQRLSNDKYLTCEEYTSFYEHGVSLLERYKNEATLVVTSRLHAASPCMAMGIPVILVANDFDGRFSWIDKYLELYTPNKFEQIDWNPKPIEYEIEKKQLLNMFTHRIKKVYEDNKDIYEVSGYYESRNSADYNKEIINFFYRMNISNSDNIRYALWGITDKTLTIKNVISDFFPNWILSTIIDESINGEFEGIKIEKSTDIAFHDKDIVYLIIPKAAHKYAADILEKQKRKYIIFDF